jgi:hypothetical protein
MIGKRVKNLVKTRGGFRKAREGDYTQTALMLEKCFVINPDNDREVMKYTTFEEMPLVPFLWYANKMLQAQGFSTETFENLREELTSDETA